MSVQNQNEPGWGERFVAWARGGQVEMDPALAWWARDDARRLAGMLAQWSAPSLLAPKALAWARQAARAKPKEPMEPGELIAAWALESAWSARHKDWAPVWNEASRACAALELALGSAGVDAPAARQKAAQAIKGAICRPSRVSIAMAWTWLAAGADPSAADGAFEFDGGSALSAALRRGAAWPVAGLLLEAGSKLAPENAGAAKAAISNALCRGGGRERARAKLACALATALAGSPNAYRGRGGLRLFDIAAGAARDDSMEIAWAMARLGVELGPRARRELLVSALPRDVRQRRSGARALDFLQTFGRPQDLAAPMWAPLIRDLAFSEDPAEAGRWIPCLARWAAAGGWSPQASRQAQQHWAALKQASFAEMVEALKERDAIDLAASGGAKAAKPRL